MKISVLAPLKGKLDDKKIEGIHRRTWAAILKKSPQGIDTQSTAHNAFNVMLEQMKGLEETYRKSTFNTQADREWMKKIDLTAHGIIAIADKAYDQAKRLAVFRAAAHGNQKEEERLI